MDPADRPRVPVDLLEAATEDTTTAVVDTGDTGGTADTMTAAEDMVEVATTATDVTVATAMDPVEAVATAAAVVVTAGVTRMVAAGVVATAATATAVPLPSLRRAVVVACRPSLPAAAAVVATLLREACTRTVGA